MRSVVSDESDREGWPARPPTDRPAGVQTRLPLTVDGLISRRFRRRRRRRRSWGMRNVRANQIEITPPKNARTVSSVRSIVAPSAVDSNAIWLSIIKYQIDPAP